MTQREMQLPALWTLVSFAKNSGFHPEYDGEVARRTKAGFPFLIELSRYYMKNRLM